MTNCIWALVFAFWCRGGNHLGCQLPIIPSGTGGQTSCRDQLQSTDTLDVSFPLHEIRPEPKHKIFLSHSGAQKSFVKQLCKDIERYDRYPFFDVLRTSLSIGCDFPKAIFKAIEQCQVAVVILSEDFFSRTKWPMLELSALVKRKSRDPDLIIMPVFLALTREQCRERENHDRWFSLWQSWAKDDKRIILDDWMAVFKVFGYINSISLCGWDEVKCREDVVDAVCKEVPPETWHDDSHVQGRSRMCKVCNVYIGC